jgi:hypothetical protein
MAGIYIPTATTPMMITAEALGVTTAAQTGAGCLTTDELWMTVIAPPGSGVRTMGSSTIIAGASPRYQAGDMEVNHRARKI